MAERPAIEQVNVDTYIGAQAAVECPDCGKEGVILGVEEIPHGVLPITLPLNKCFRCGFTYTDYRAEDIEEAYIAKCGWPQEIQTRCVQK